MSDTEIKSTETLTVPVEESYKLTKYGNYLVLNLSGELKDSQAESFLKTQISEIEKNGLDLIINCNYLTKMSQPWLHAFISVEQTLKKIKKRLRLILVKDEIRSMISAKALDRVLPVYSDLREALVDLGLINKKSLDVGFINPFLEATLHVLKIQGDIGAAPGKVYIKKEMSELSGDISGVIGLVSESFTGNVIISFPEKTFLTLMSKMMGEEYTEISKENADGASELTNMIFGQAKITLNEQGYGIKTALPSIIIGKNHRFSANQQELIVVVPFNSDMGSFYVEICISDNLIQS